MLPRRQLGNTPLWVSPIGLGTVKFGRNTQVKYPQPFDLPTLKTLAHLLEQAQAVGINLLDTAPAYGDSEMRLGQLLQGQRDQWILSSKAGEHFDGTRSRFDFSPQGLRASVETSLKQLKTHYLDILLIHSDGQDLHQIQVEKVFHTAHMLKKEGLVRAVGMSTKTLAGSLHTVMETDVVMLTYHPLYTTERPAIELAHTLKKGVLIKKALNSGQLGKNTHTYPLQRTLETLLKTPGVSSLVLGSINAAHIRENAHWAEKILSNKHNTDTHSVS